MYWIHFETRNFDFDAFGKTEQECLTALLEGIAKHCDQYPDADRGYLEHVAIDEYHAIKIKMGTCLRDRDTI